MTRKYKRLYTAALWSITGLVLIFAVFALVNGPIAAQPTVSLDLTKSTVGEVSEVESGEPFTYELKYKCASITENCIGAVITDPLPLEVEYISLSSNPVHIQSAAYNAVNHEVIFTFVDPLPAGSTGVLKIDVRFPPGTLPGTQSTNTATFDADNADAVDSAPVTVTATGQFEMFPQKTLVGEAVVGFPITFDLELCSPDSTGGVNMLNPVFVDQLPSEAAFVTAEGTEGTDWTYDSGAHTVTFNNLPTATVGGCLTRQITLIYDVAPAGTQTNTLTVSGTPEACDGSVSPLPGVHKARLTWDPLQLILT